MPRFTLLRGVVSWAALVGLLSALGGSPAWATKVKPRVSSFTATPSNVGVYGGTERLSASVENANTCEISANVPVAELPQTVPCTEGSVSQSVTLPANTGKKKLKYKLTLVAKANGERSGKAKVNTAVAVSPKNVNCFATGKFAYLVGCDFEDRIFPGGVNWEGADFENANLNYARLSHVYFEGVKLAGASVTQLHADHIEGLPESLPTNWRAVNGFLVGPQADLRFDDLDGAQLAGADLTETVLVETSLRANLAGANLSLSNDQGFPVDFEGANLRGANLSGAALAEANFEHAEAREADFEEADLQEANLSHAGLFSLNVRYAWLGGATFLGSMTYETNFWEAHFDENQPTICWDGKLSTEEGNGCYPEIG